MNYFIKKNKMNCKICFEQYNKNKHKPVILMQCGHSVCITCLNELTTFLCPICREQIITSKPNYDLIYFLFNTNIFLNNKTFLKFIHP